MKDPFIDNLVGDLTVVKPWTNYRFWLGVGLLYALACSVFIGGMGVRSDYQDALMLGTLVLKPAIFLGIAVSATLLAKDIAKPSGQFVPHHTSLAFLSLIILALLFSHQYQQAESGWLYESVASSCRKASGFHCFVSILSGGGLLLISTWRFWVVKTATLNAKWMGILCGVASGAFVASAYAFHCTVDATPYLIMYYFTPILILAYCGRYLGLRYLKW